MRIALIAHVFYPSVGGVEITADILARGFIARHGAEVVVITNTKQEDNSRTFPYRVVRRPSPLRLFTLLRQADVVFHNNPAISLWWPLALLRKPWMVTLRMWITLPGQKLGPLERIKYALKYRIIGQADVIAANSQVLADHVAQDVEVIPNSYRDQLFTVLDDEVRDPLGVVYLGRLSEDKGVDLLVKAAARLAGEIEGFSLTVIGDGAERKRLEGLARSSGLGTAVSFLGSLGPEESNRVLNRNSIAVIPSRMPEPFGTVAVEAAAAGCVVLYANHGGLPASAGKHAVSFTPLDADSLYHQLRALLLDPNDVASRRTEAMEHAHRHRESIMVDRYYAAILRTLKESKHGKHQ